MLNEIIAKLIFIFNRWKNVSKFEKHYKKFKVNENHSQLEFPMDNESGCIYGEIAYMIASVEGQLKRVLFTGEENNSKVTLKSNINKLQKSKIFTTGLSKDVDYNWNFEKTPPKLGKFSLIVSQAMFEHLMDPYKHFCDLANHLEIGGHLIIHTVMPGFFYHRHPIDSLRYYPDWFEEMASPDRCNLKIAKKMIRNMHIFYMYTKI